MAISDSEKQLLDELRDEVITSIKLQYRGAEVPEDVMSEVLGQGLGMYDALFAIREGASWRGMTDPKEIARVVLRQLQLGDQ